MNIIAVFNGFATNLSLVYKAQTLSFIIHYSIDQFTCVDTTDIPDKKFLNSGKFDPN